MVLRRSLALATGLFVALASPTSACVNHSLAEHAVALESASPPTAQPVPPDPQVGAVYIGSSHLCTGSVLDSPAGDLILTAGHCVPAGPQLAFVAACREPRRPRASGTSTRSTSIRAGCSSRIRWPTSRSHA